MKSHLRSLAAFAFFLLLSTTIAGQDSTSWTRFRGNNADGVAADNDSLPLKWSNTENVKWIADVPGWGWSCPIVTGDRVYITSVVGEEKNLTPSKGLYLGEGVRDPAKGVHHWMVYCYNKNTGEKIWEHESHTGQPKIPRHPKSSYAAETAATDGERVYALFGDVGLYCYDLNGKPLWSKQIEPKKTLNDWGAAASPVVHDGQVFVVYDNMEGSWIASFDAKTGEQRWKESRDETHSWATPFVWQNELRTEIVVPAPKKNRGYSLDGEFLWEFDGQMSNLAIPSPFAAHGFCYIASGYVGDKKRPTIALKPGAAGDFTADNKDLASSEHVAWFQPKIAPYNTTQIVYGDYLYTLFDRGFFTCHNAKTGEEVYGKHRFEPSGSFTASPWAYNGHVFCLSEDGLTYVVKAGPEFEVVELNKLDELSLASPGISGNMLLLRTESKLYGITQGAEIDPAIAKKMKPRRDIVTANATDIFSAVSAGNLEETKRAIQTGAKVNQRNSSSGATPLNTAALFGHTEVAKLLLNKGADVNATNKDGNTALHLAVFFCHEELVRLLLESGADINAKSERGDTPLATVSGDWNEQLANLYTGIGNAIGIEVDLDHYKETRPKITKILTEQAANENEQKTSANEE